jgi:hypothetical protein
MRARDQFMLPAISRLPGKHERRPAGETSRLRKARALQSG